MGLDCIFHLRGVPYSRWTFSILEEWRSLAADCPISIIFTSYWYAAWYTEKESLCLFCFQPCLVDWALRRSPNNLTHSPHRSRARNPVTWLLRITCEILIKCFLTIGQTRNKINENDNFLLMQLGRWIFWQTHNLFRQFSWLQNLEHIS